MIGAACTQPVHDRGVAALVAYEHTAAAAKARYFRTHRTAVLRRAYLSAQQRRLAALKVAAGCHVPQVTVTAGPDVSAADADTVRAAVPVAQSFFSGAGTTVDAKIFAYGSRATTEQGFMAFYNATQANADQVWATATAVGGNGVIFVNTGSSGWQAISSAEREKIVVHELFHVEQSTLDTAWDSASRGATWLLEGSAEYVGWAAVIAAGQVSSDAVQSELTAEAALANGSLADYEDGSAYARPALYPLGALAVQKLVQDHGLASLAAYWRAMSTAATWQDAFQQAFGLTPADFYASFSAR